MTADLVIFGEDWGRHPTSSQALAAELARDRRVLWVNSVGLRRPRLSDAGRVAAKLRAAAAPRPVPVPTRAQGPAAIVAPLAVPFPGAALARRANAMLWRRGVGRRAAAMGLSRPILWLSLPTAIDARHAVDHRALVYYCGDDFGALAGVDHAPVLALERELAEAADLIVVSHRRLAAKFPAEKVLYLPHGVSAARFAGASAAPPAGVPVAGYLGLIDGRTDFDALAAAARALPGWRIVLAGPVAAEAAGAVARLARLPNVTLCGPVPPGEVPALLAGWTAALLPYRDTPMTRACDPLKLREYLAAGLPVAAFPFAAGLPHGDLFTLCAPDGLAAALDALAAEPPGRRAARRAAMAGEDWAVRARVLSDALERLG